MYIDFPPWVSFHSTRLIRCCIPPLSFSPIKLIIMWSLVPTFCALERKVKNFLLSFNLNPNGRSTEKINQVLKKNKKKKKLQQPTSTGMIFFENFVSSDFKNRSYREIETLKRNWLIIHKRRYKVYIKDKVGIWIITQ